MHAVPSPETQVGSTEMSKWPPEPDRLGSVSCQLCGLGQVTSPLCASVSQSVKWGRREGYVN